ncbi:hypothetical protein XENORESO_011241, partial [Xenotaenia resolanae]
CSDDLWIDQLRTYKCEVSGSVRGSIGHLRAVVSENIPKLRCGCSVPSFLQSQTWGLFGILASILLCLTLTFLLLHLTVCLHSQPYSSSQMGRLCNSVHPLLCAFFSSFSSVPLYS